MARIMATRNQTALFRKYREALRSVRPTYASTSSSVGGGRGGGGAIELVEAPLLSQGGGPRGYNALGAEDLDAASLRFEPAQ